MVPVQVCLLTIPLCQRPEGKQWNTLVKDMVGHILKAIHIQGDLKYQ